MPTATQSNRYLAIETALGPDKVLLQRFSGREELGRMFQYNVELLSEERKIDVDQVIGTNATVRFDPTENQSGEKIRYFNGFISEFSHTGFRGKFGCYEAVMVPWLWFLTKRSDCRIFQKKSVQQIVEKVFKDAGFNEFEFRLRDQYEPSEFCVQYRETDFNFISRLCEQYGIFYYFEHQNGNHKAIFTDSTDSIQKGRSKPIYFRWTEEQDRKEYAILDWTIGKVVKSGVFKHNDFDFENPKQATSRLLTTSSNAKSHSKADNEIYDGIGEYVQRQDGEKFARVRLEELQCDHETGHGETTDTAIFAGERFDMDSHPLTDQNREYHATSAHYDIRVDDYTSGSGGVGQVYSCSFSAVPKKQQFRPARITPKPAINGPQTAIVSGPAGEEIYCDKYGRVKVQFHWDREGKSDANSSCWVRVSQPWAGKDWGGMAIPRIGQEVIVEFLEGDPDRPIITGRIYNADCMPPYALPANKTQTGIKSRSTLNGGSSNFNELRFEDKKGDEKIYFHAEKDFERIVENDDAQTIGVPGPSLQNGSQTVTIWKDQKIVIKTGNHSLKIETGKSTKEAMQSIELKCGESTITMTPIDITIKSPIINIEGQGMVNVGSPMTTVKGDGALTLKGGLTLIN